MRPIKRLSDLLRTFTGTRRVHHRTSSVGPFEAMLHGLTDAIDRADSHSHLESTFLNLARDLAPGHQIELTADCAPAPLCTHGPGDIALASSSDSLANSDRENGGIVELRIRCGGNHRGRLRISPRSTRAMALDERTLRRLATLGTLALCAIERLDYEHAASQDGAEEISKHTPGKNDASVDEAKCAGPVVDTSGMQDATFLNAVLPFAINQARRHNETLSLALVSIDRLSAIHELMGRAVAERLVKSVGERIASSIRSSDIIARLDDDRVVVVLPRASLSGAINVAQKLCEHIASQSHGDQELSRVTASIGVATYPTCAEDVCSLFAAADEALARAQIDGRNQASPAPQRAAVCAVTPG
jgi:diguanylate cyclase (GGDEF)-like protein